MSLSKGKLIADPAIVYDGDSVIVHMRDGAGNAITSTGGALDVNIDNASIVVTSTDLDIRDLSFATDKVDVSGSSNVAVTDGGGSLTVDGTVAVSSVGGTVTVAGTVELGATSLAALETIELGATTLAALENITVSSTDLDIRDLSHAQDSVKIGDGTDFLAINNDGSINVVGSFTINGQYAEDSAHSSGNVGLYNLAVRADAPAVATSADGDYASQTVDAYNRSWVNSGANIAIAAGAATVTTSSALLVAAAAGQRRIKIYNNGSKRVFVGPSGVSSANGWIIDPGVDEELEIGPNIALHAVSSSGSQEIRYLQLS